MSNKLKTFTNGIIKENPVLVLVLGTCPTIATSTSVLNALGMGLAATFVLLGSNIVISLLRNIIPNKVRIPCFRCHRRLRFGGAAAASGLCAEPLSEPRHFPAAYRSKLHHPRPCRDVCQQE